MIWVITVILMGIAGVTGFLVGVAYGQEHNHDDL